MGVANGSNMYAKDNKVIYEYDKNGRVSTATYPDGLKLTYKYDSNGNIEKIEKVYVNSTDGKDKDSLDNTGNDNNDGSGFDAATGNGEETGSEKASDSESIVGDDGEKDDGGGKKAAKPYEYTLEYLNNLNNFKKRKIVNLKAKITKNKRIKMTIKPSKKKADRKYKEMIDGYQIRYAGNKSFKKSKMFSSKVKNGTKKLRKSMKAKYKTTYIKARAYTIRADGRKEYSRYCKAIAVDKK